MTTHLTSSKAQATEWPKQGIRWGVILGLCLAVAGCFLISLVVGSVSIPLDEVLTVLLGGEPTRATWETIILKFRLPKAVTAVLGGAALSVSGLQMQTLFRNPLADPFILGISSGASLGVALVVLGGTVSGAATLIAGLGLIGNFGIVTAATIGSGMVFGLVLMISRRVQSVVTLLVLGLMFGYLTGSVVSILLYFSNPQQIQSYVAWTFGSFGGVTWDQLTVLLPVVLVGLLIALFAAKPLNALLLGENYARSMGLNLRRARYLVIGSASLLTGAITAFCGPIAFLGIAVPHIAKGLLNSSDHRLLIPASILIGGLLALIFDLIAQLPGGQIVLPLNAVTSLVGAPLVTWIILRRQTFRGAFGS